MRKNSRLSADEIKKVDKGTIPAEVSRMTGHVTRTGSYRMVVLPLQKMLNGFHDGVVVRAMKSSENAVGVVNMCACDNHMICALRIVKDEYEGLIRPNSPIQGSQDVIPYSFISLQNYQIQLQHGDPVSVTASVVMSF